MIPVPLHGRLSPVVNAATIAHEKALAELRSSSDGRRMPPGLPVALAALDRAAVVLGEAERRVAAHGETLAAARERVAALVSEAASQFPATEDKLQGVLAAAMALEMLGKSTRALDKAKKEVERTETAVNNIFLNEYRLQIQVKVERDEEAVRAFAVPELAKVASDAQALYMQAGQEARALFERTLLPGAGDEARKAAEAAQAAAQELGQAFVAANEKLEAVRREANELQAEMNRANRVPPIMSEYFAPEIAEARRASALDEPRQEPARKARKADHLVEPTAHAGRPWRNLYLAQAERLVDALRCRHELTVRQRGLGVLNARTLAEQAGREHEIDDIWLSPPMTCSPLAWTPAEQVYIANIEKLAAVHASEAIAA